MTPIYCVGLHKINITVGYLSYLDETEAVSLLCLVESKAVRYTGISNYQGIKSLGQRYFSSLPKFVI